MSELVTGGNKPIVAEGLDEREPDELAKWIVNKHTRWVALRTQEINHWQEVRRYLYATDSSSTSGAAMPWSNNIAIPKLMSLHDILVAHYSAALFPPKRWISWEGADDASEDKARDITDYMNHVIDQIDFKDEVEKCIHDFLTTGNAFAQASWRPDDVFPAPQITRIAPIDITFDPTVSKFKDTPKIVRELLSLGEAYRLVEDLSPNKEDASDIIKWMEGNRTNYGNIPGGREIHYKDEEYVVEGFGSYRAYMESGTAEILTFYGDIFDPITKELQRNRKIRVIDGYYVISNEPGVDRIFHATWRPRPDSLYGMSPYANLLGIQYRIDHLENIRADIFDTFAYPPVKVVGDVSDFSWGPMEKIFVGDDGDVAPMWANLAGLGQDVDNQVANLINMMEEMVGAPKEAAGFRTPGEKTATEVKRLENAATRIFNQRIEQFERMLVEPIVNSMLDVAVESVTPTTVRTYDTNMKVADFKAVGKENLEAKGRIRATAARNYAEKLMKAEELMGWYNSAAGQDTAVLQHFSSKKTAHLWEELLNIQDDNIVSDFIRISESMEAQQLSGAAQGELQKQGLNAPGAEEGSSPAGGAEPTGGLPPAM